MSFTDKSINARTLTVDVITSKSGDPIRVDALTSTAAITTSVAPTVVIGAWSGTIASTASSFTYARNGNLVTLQFLGLPATTETSANPLAFSVAVPVGYRPTAPVRTAVVVTETAADLPVYVDVSILGAILMTSTIAFAGANDLSFPAFTVSYFIL